jgi:adenosine deaminase CECR1
LVSPEELEWYLDECLQLKQKYPDVIAGFDLVGAEDTGRPLADYLVPLIAFQERVKELGIDLPFLFHAGETLDDGGQTDGNLYDAILLGTKRIGHGCVTSVCGALALRLIEFASGTGRFSLVKHPELIRVCREKGICVESCPISNEILVGSWVLLPCVRLTHGVSALHRLSLPTQYRQCSTMVYLSPLVAMILGSLLIWA